MDISILDSNNNQVIYNLDQGTYNSSFYSLLLSGCLTHRLKIDYMNTNMNIEAQLFNTQLHYNRYMLS